MFTRFESNIDITITDRNEHTVEVTFVSPPFFQYSMECKCAVLYANI